MNEQANQKLEQEVGAFLNQYKILAPEAKAQFEAQLLSSIGQQGLASQRLYRALLKAAQEGESVEQALQRMHQADQENQAKFLG